MKRTSGVIDSLMSGEGTRFVSVQCIFGLFSVPLVEVFL